VSDEVAVASVKVEGIETFGNVEVVDVEDDDRLIDKATVVFDDTHGIAAATMLEQRKVVIELGWTKEQARIFEGIVWRVKTECRADGSGSKQRVTLVALDMSYKLNQGEGKPKVHPVGKLSDILKSIVAPYQIPVGQIKLVQDPEFKAEAPLTQGPKTDWAFIQELAIRYGARAFVEVNGDKSQFYFVSEKFFLEGEPMGQMTYEYGTGALVEFTYQRLASGAAPMRSAIVTDPLTGLPAVKQGAATAPETPISPDPDHKSRLDKLGLGMGSLYSDVVDVVSKSEGKAEDGRAKEFVAGLPSDPLLGDSTIQQDPTRSLGFIGYGTVVGNVQLRAKGKITINGIAPWAAGDWYLRRVNHQIARAGGVDKQGRARGGYITRFIVTR
jgi:hypothetical protein